MDVKELKENILEDIKRKIEERGVKALFIENHVDKVNESYDGLSITPIGSKVGINVNISAICQAIDEGRDYTETLNKVVDSVVTGLKNMPYINEKSIVDYELMKKRLILEIIPIAGNEKILQKVPFDRREDMAVVYRLLLKEKSDGCMTTLVTDDLLRKFGVTHAQLRRDALINAPILRPYDIKPLSAVMRGLMGCGEITGVPPEEEMAYVATVPGGNRGACVVAYPGFFREAAKKLGCDFFVLPSSIHEVILVKDNGNTTAGELGRTVRDINASLVDPTEKLTDSVYHYDVKEHVFELASQFEIRRKAYALSQRPVITEKIGIPRENIVQRDALGELTRNVLAGSRGGEER